MNTIYVFSWRVDVNGKGSALTGGPLNNDIYLVEQFHCHWGCSDGRGSEHVRIVHAFKLTRNIKLSSLDRRWIVVLGWIAHCPLELVEICIFQRGCRPSRWLSSSRCFFEGILLLQILTADKPRSRKKADWHVIKTSNCRTNTRSDII